VSHPAAAAHAHSERRANIVRRNPNAAVALTSGSGVGALAVWGLTAAGVGIPPEIGAVLAGAVSAAVLFVGKNGLVGVWGLVMRGRS
jgi:hypothetical protein